MLSDFTSPKVCLLVTIHFYRQGKITHILQDFFSFLIYQQLRSHHNFSHCVTNTSVRLETTSFYFMILHFESSPTIIEIYRICEELTIEAKS